MEMTRPTLPIIHALQAVLHLNLRSHKKFRPDWLSRFDVYWIQTNRHPYRLNLYIDGGAKRFNHFSFVFNTICCYQPTPSPNQIVSEYEVVTSSLVYIAKIMLHIGLTEMSSLNNFKRVFVSGYSECVT